MHTPAHGLRRHFQVLSALAVVVLIVDAYFSGSFGATINNASMIGLAAISIGSGIMLVAAVYYYRLGYELFGKVLGGVWVSLFAFNILSNMGVATANRVVEVADANIKQAVHQQHAQAKDEAKARLALFEGQLATLLERNAWAGTVRADGLRRKLADLRIARDSEAKLGGCGPKCRGIENQIVDVGNQIAIAEQRENLEARIDATKRVLAEARTTLASADAGISHTASQAALYSRWTNGWFGDGESATAVRNSNEVMGMLMAFVIAIASVGLTLAGVWDYLMSVRPQTPYNPLSPTAPSTAQAHTSTRHTEPQGLMVVQKTVGDCNREKLAALLRGEDILAPGAAA